MKFSIWILLYVFSAQIVCAAENPVFSQDIATWKRYVNTKYNYEISYPEKLELRATGSKSKRDGKSFIIQIPETARSHGLSVQLYPNKSMKQIIKEELSFINIENLKNDTFKQIINKEQLIRISKDKIHNHPTIRVEFIHIPTGIIFERYNIFDKVLFTFGDSFGGFNKKISSKIISSFKFHK